MRQIVITITVILIFGADVFGCATIDLIGNPVLSDSGNAVLTRPVTQYDWITPDSLFRIHFDTEGPNAVYHPYEDLNPVDGIPDYVNRCGDFLSESHRIIIEELEFDPPPPDNGLGGDSRYDIYMTNVPALTTPESPSNEYPGRPAYTSYIQLGYDMRTPQYPDDPYPFLKVSAAHEYFHATEFAYRAYSTDVTPWWFESCAEWTEDVVFDDVNDVYYQLPEYLQNLHKSLYQTSGFFIYGAWLFPDFISESIGPWLIQRCWEKFASFDLAIEAIKLTFDEFDLDFNTEYCRHTIWDYFTGLNYRQGFYHEGGYFGTTVNIAASYQEYPVPWNQQPIEQQNVSAAYIEFLKPDISKGSLVLEYDNMSEDLHFLSIVVVRITGEIEYGIHRIENSVIPIFTVDDFASCEKVIMIPVWGYEGYQAEGTTYYSYRALIDSVSTSIATVDDLPSRFNLEGVYPNPFNGSASIAFTLPIDENFEIRVYDITGRRVLTRRESGRQGYNSVNLKIPEPLAGGVYFFALERDNQVLRGKLMYLK
ncbi:MAG: MXAN_6640 family putative metalloprotease [candidate division Zixibacteria bacterium]